MTAERHNNGKPQLSYLLDFDRAMEEFARVCEFGATKYARDNWRKGRPYRDTIDSALRHMLEFQNGADTDPETSCNHLAHAAWNCLALLQWHLEGTGTDDRYRRATCPKFITTDFSALSDDPLDFIQDHTQEFVIHTDENEIKLTAPADMPIIICDSVDIDEQIEEAQAEGIDTDLCSFNPMTMEFFEPGDIVEYLDNLWNGRLFTYVRPAEADGFVFLEPYYPPGTVDKPLNGLWHTDVKGITHAASVEDE